MSLLLVLSFASAAPLAPWNYVISASLPDVPAFLPVYATGGTPAVSLADLQDVFGLTATPEWVDLLGGFEMVQDDQSRLYVFDRGGSAFHDLALMPGDRPIQTVGDDALWRSSEALLEDLGLLDNDLVTLSPARIGGCRAQRHTANGPVGAAYSCGQAASWAVAVDGWPTFGPGSDVTVRYGDGGTIVAFEEAFRELDVASELPVLPAADALATWMRVGAQTHRWNMLRTATPELESVEITSVELGYFMPDRLSAATYVVPVYAISAVAHSGNGEPDANVLWYQPAVRGIEIPELELPKVR